MPVSFEDAYSNAQKAVGSRVWEQLSDVDRLRAVRDHMCRMDADQVQAEVEKSLLPTAARNNSLRDLRK